MCHRYDPSELEAPLGRAGPEQAYRQESHRQGQHRRGSHRKFLPGDVAPLVHWEVKVEVVVISPQLWSSSRTHPPNSWDWCIQRTVPGLECCYLQVALPILQLCDGEAARPRVNCQFRSRTHSHGYEANATCLDRRGGEGRWQRKSAHLQACLGRRATPATPPPPRTFRPAPSSSLEIPPASRKHPPRKPTPGPSPPPPPSSGRGKTSGAVQDVMSLPAR